MTNAWLLALLGLATSSVVVALRGHVPAAAANTEDAVYQIALEQLFQSGQLDLISDDDDDDDDDEDTSRYGPWSYEPACTASLGALGGRPLCVYTNRSFAGGRGLSVFTTPQIAEHIAGLPAFQVHDVLEHGVNDLKDGTDSHGINKFDHVTTSSHWVDEINEINETQGCWYTRPIPNKGIGMFAKKHLRRGDLITAYTPVLVAYSETLLSRAEREKFLQLAINQLPGPTREGYLQLATVYGDPRIVVQDIASANTFGMSFRDAEPRSSDHSFGSAQHLAVIPEPSRINHACDPNAQFVIDPTHLTHRVYAVRPIARDEEITIAYTNPLDTYARRQNHLKRAFGFTCSCARCRRGQAGDAALAEIQALQTSLADWTMSAAEGIKLAERLIKVYLDHGLHGFLDPPYCHAALAYSAAGSLRGTVKYLDLAIEAIKLRLGLDDPDLAAWEEMRREPTAHWSWRRRKKRKERKEKG